MVFGRESTPEPVKLVYKTVPASKSSSGGGLPEIPLHLDVYPPGSHLDGTSTSGDDGGGVSAVVYFHGGGLLAGDRKSWFPEWLRGESFSVPSIHLQLLTGNRSVTARRTSLWAGCSLNLCGLPITLALHGTRYPRGHPRPLFVYPERSQFGSR